MSSKIDQQSKVDSNFLRDRVEHLEKDVLKYQRKIANMTKEKANDSTKIQEMLAENSALNIKVKRLTVQQSKLEQDYELLERQYDELDGNFASLQDYCQEFYQDTKQFRKEIFDLKLSNKMLHDELQRNLEQNTTLRMELANSRALVEQLQEESKNHENNPQQVKFKKTGKSIFSPLKFKSFRKARAKSNDEESEPLDTFMELAKHKKSL